MFTTTPPRPVVSLPAASEFSQVLTLDLKEIRAHDYRYIFSTYPTGTDENTSVYLKDTNDLTSVYPNQLNDASSAIENNSTPDGPPVEQNREVNSSGNIK